LHTGTLYDDKKYDRLMHRLWAKGDKPIGVADSLRQKERAGAR
jgi:taurine dioxygenase